MKLPTAISPDFFRALTPLNVVIDLATDKIYGFNILSPFTDLELLGVVRLRALR